MSRNVRGQQNYEARLTAFLSQIDDVRKRAPGEEYLHAIMDTVPFRDLETALMMAQMDMDELALSHG